MSEYIEKERALQEIDEWIESGEENNLALRYARKYVNMIPAADVRPAKPGHWVKIGEEKEVPGGIVFDPVWKCSECGREYDPAVCHVIKYCYNCGAKMGGQNG